MNEVRINMALNFNLWDEPWLQVIMNDGSKQEVSLYDAIKDAHKIAEIRDENPLFEIGIHRMLIALVMDAYEIKDTSRIRDLIDRKSFDVAILDAYKKKYYENFDLFGETVRFYQFSPREHDFKEKSIANILMDLPQGTNSILFHHTYEDQLTVSPKVCAKALCSVSAYVLAAGTGYRASAAGHPPIYSLIYADSLFEILLFNSCPDSLLNNSSRYGPAWTIQEEIGKLKHKIADVSTTLGLTWQRGQKFEKLSLYHSFNNIGTNMATPHHSINPEGC